MRKTTSIAVFMLISIIIALNSASAIIIKDIQSDILNPGKSGKLTVMIENDLSDYIEDVSMSIDLSNSPFSTIGSSEDTIDEIEDDETDTFVFTLSANTDAKTGDYNIPYTITYKNANTTKRGTLGVKVRANSNLDFVTALDNPIVGEKASLSLKIINKGLGDAKFVSIEVEPSGYTLLSEKKVYIGSITSDDYETASFDIILKSTTPNLIAEIEYEDFDGKKYIENIDLQLKAYTLEKAVELGIISKNSTSAYITIIILIVIIWLVIRAIRKVMRKRKNAQSANNK